MTALTIGRDPGSDIVLRDASVSRRHADVEGMATGEYRLRDLSSANGTFVIEDGDWVRIDVATVDGGEPVMFGDMRTTLAELIDPSQLKPPGEADRDAPSERPSKGRSLAQRTADTHQAEEQQDDEDGAPNASTAQLVYILYAAAFIVPFTGIAGVIVAYVNRDEAAGTWLESHYRWQIGTFWIWLLFTAIGLITAFILIGFLILAATIVWYIVRIVIGWQQWSKREPVRKPTSWFF